MRVSSLVRVVRCAWDRQTRPVCGDHTRAVASVVSRPHQSKAAPACSHTSSLPNSAPPPPRINGPRPLWAGLGCGTSVAGGLPVRTMPLYWVGWKEQHPPSSLSATSHAWSPHTLDPHCGTLGSLYGTLDPLPIPPLDPATHNVSAVVISPAAVVGRDAVEALLPRRGAPDVPEGGAGVCVCARVCVC